MERTIQHEKTCQQCGKEFKSKRIDSKFCSGVCRAKANRINPQSEPVISQKDVMVEILEELKAIHQVLLNDDRILTIDEACKMLDISRPTFERYQADGLLVVHHFGKEGEGKKKGRGRKGYLLFSEILKALKQGEQG